MTGHDAVEWAVTIARSMHLWMGIARQRLWPGSVTCDARRARDRPRTASPPQFAAL